MDLEQSKCPTNIHQYQSLIIFHLVIVLGDVKAENLPHKGLAHIYPLMHSFQKCVRKFLQNSRVIINDDIAYKVYFFPVSLFIMREVKLLFSTRYFRYGCL